MNIVDLSNRRGAIVHLLPQVYDLLKEYKGELSASGGKPGDFDGVPNYVLWMHDMNKAVVDINKKWVFALRGTNYVMGLMFYRLGTDGVSLYIDYVMGTPAVIDELIKKFEQNDLVKAREKFYVGRDVKREAAEEVLGTVGLQDDTVFNEEGYQPIGGMKEALAALKFRYS